MAINRKKPAKKEETKAVAFVNYSIPLKKGGVKHSTKGFPIWDNEYTTDMEKLFVKAAEQHDGFYEIKNVTLRICLNEGKSELTTDDI